MTKKIQFHAGKNHKKSKGGLNPQTQKEKKSCLLQGLNSWPLHFKSKTLPLSHGDILQVMDQHYIVNYQPNF